MIVAVEALWLAKPSIAARWKMRRPIVRMIRQPPIAVPRVSAAPQTSFTQSGTVSESRWPLASSSAATTPIDFCASLAPWPKDSAADIAHSAPRIGVRTRRVARRSASWLSRAKRKPKASPTKGETARAMRTPRMPTGRSPSSPPQCRAPAPASAKAAPARPPTRAWAELDGSPRHQVSRFQVDRRQRRRRRSPPPPRRRGR